MKTITQTKGKTMKIDQVVQCPADRGELPYLGRITHISQAVQKNIHGIGAGYTMHQAQVTADSIRREYA